MATDWVILGAREVVSVPLSADFTLPETSGLPCVFVLVLKGVGLDTGSRNTGPGPDVLKGVPVIVSNSLRKEGRAKVIGVVTEMGSRVGLGGGIGNSLIHSAAGSSGPVCIVSIRADGAGIMMSNAALSSSSNSLITLPTIVLTNTSLTGTEVPAVHVLDQWRGSGLAGASSSRVGSEALD